MKIKGNRKGFTLIEMLIVIGIIGILAVGLGKLIIGGPQKARDAARKSAVGQLVQAIEAYNLDTGNYPKPSSGQNSCTSALSDLESYFPNKQMPVDPSGETKGFSKDGKGSPTCDKDKGFLYVVPKDKTQGFHYMVMARMEDDKQGNLEKANIATDGSAITADKFGSKGEYYVIVK